VKSPNALLLLIIFALTGYVALGQRPAPNAKDAEETPIGPKWWPSEWGADDQRGAANRLTPKKVLQAKDLIRTGQIYQLGRVYQAEMPILGKRHFALTIPGLPTGAPNGKNQLVHNDEMFSGEIGQMGTQFDGLGHIGVHMDNDNIFYNGNKLSEFGNAYGLKKLGVENAGPFVTRGVLLDVAGVKEERSLKGGYAITVADLKKALAAANVAIEPGDVVLIRTGHGIHWMTDNKKFNESEPGIGMEAARWLTDQKVTLIGADNWAIEVVPSENPDRPFEVHQWDLTRNGVYHLENLDLDALAKDKVYEFAFVFVPLPLKGATGSPGNPIAIR
jgi:kynurenine formamidase